MKEKEKKNEFYKMLYLLGFLKEMNPWFFPLSFLRSLCSCARTVCNLIITAKTLDNIIIGKSEKEVLFFVIIMVVSNMILTLLMHVIDKILIVIGRKIGDTADIMITKKALTMDYQILETIEIQNKIESVREGMNARGDFRTYCQNITQMLSCFLYGISAFLILLKLVFQVKEAGLVLFFLILIVAIFNFKMLKKANQMEYDFFQDCIPLNREFRFFYNFIQDYHKGKQVRIYDMTSMLLHMMKERENYSMKKLRKNREKQVCYQSKMQIVNSCLILFISYLFVGIKTIQGEISIGNMTLYVGAITSFVQAITEFISFSSYVVTGSKYLCNYTEFLELKNEKYQGTLPIEKRLDNEYELEFRNVSFHYPNSKEDILKHITAKIKVGGKMAIVGRNGSGKSTFIKLLCRLYDPTEGEILLNNINIRKYDYDEYRRIFSVVFQDFKLLSFSIAGNVAADTSYDKEKVWLCLKKTGLSERVKEMPKGIETVIYKQEEEGVEISGGEEQKLAIARALYKDAAIMILDEPTAALDPISELEIYEQFNEIVQEKTAIYISHRMSSCRFCENILVFDDGNMIQHGSHEELLKQEKGLYAKLWNAQAQYYKR